MIADDVKARLEAAFPDARVSAVGDGSRMEIGVASIAFEGQSRVKRQQLVYAAIDELIKAGDLHAVTIVASTPAAEDG